MNDSRSPTGDSASTDFPLTSRRQWLRAAGAAGAAGLLARAAQAGGLSTGTPSADSSVSTLLQGSCTLTPTATAGPFYLDLNLLRQDITEGKPGLRTQLYLNIVRESDCSPIKDAVVDVWQTDALGLYSGVPALGTAGMTFLRGIQVTDANGDVRFDTIYPGWYPGRTVHFHVKVRPIPTQELTTQLYMPDSLTARIHKRVPPYNQKGVGATNNGNDGSFTSQTLMAAIPNFSGGLSIDTGMTIVVA